MGKEVGNVHLGERRQRRRMSKDVRRRRKKWLRRAGKHVARIIKKEWREIEGKDRTRAIWARVESFRPGPPCRQTLPPRPNSALGYRPSATAGGCASEPTRMKANTHASLGCGAGQLQGKSRRITSEQMEKTLRQLVLQCRTYHRAKNLLPPGRIFQVHFGIDTRMNPASPECPGLGIKSHVSEQSHVLKQHKLARTGRTYHGVWPDPCSCPERAVGHYRFGRLQGTEAKITNATGSAERHVRVQKRLWDAVSLGTTREWVSVPLRYK
jgi:hypothetical protein